MRLLTAAIGLVLGLTGILLISIYAGGWTAIGVVMLIWGDSILNGVTS